jgi:eukaryotic-like serine/threonine-protein kinase
VTLYELLTLRHAFDDNTRDELLQAIESRDPVAPRRINPAISVDLETILLKAMAKRSLDRYASAGELANDLRRFLDGKPTLARRPSWTDRMTKWAVRRRRWVVATFALLCLAYIGVFLAMSMIAEQRDREMASAARARFFLQQSHQVVDRFGGILSDHLSTVSGSDAVRTELLNEAVRYYTDFLAYAQTDPDLRREVGFARYQLALAYGRLGNHGASEKQYQSAIRELQELDSLGESLEVSSVLALCLNSLGVLYRNTGRYALAEQELLQALELYQSLTTGRTEPHAYDRPYSVALANAAMLYWSMGDRDKSADLFSQSIARLENCLQDSADTIQPDERLAIEERLFECRNNYIAVLAEIDPSAAEAQLRSTLLEMEKPLTAEDANASSVSRAGVQWQIQLAATHSNLASLLSASGHLDEAEYHAQQGLERIQSQLDADHLPPTAMLNYATTYNNLGEILWKKRAWELSDQAFLKSEQLLRTELQKTPLDPEMLSRLAGVLNNHGLLAESRADFTVASQRLTQAIDTQAQAIKLAPLNTVYRQSLAAHQQNLDRTLQSIQAEISDLHPHPVDTSSSELGSAESLATGLSKE